MQSNDQSFKPGKKPSGEGRPNYFVFRQMTSSLFVSRQLPLRSTATLAA
jgi:hypothetical protein